MDNQTHRKDEMSAVEMVAALESCRADRGELSEPHFSELAAALRDDAELRAHYQSVQECDAAIKTAFADVPLPGGLAARVSRSLSEAAAAPPELAVVAPVATTPDSHVPSRPRQREVFSRRRLFVGFAALSASAVLLTAVWLGTHHPPTITPGHVMDEALDFFGQDKAPLGPLALEVPPPDDYPMSGDLRPSKWLRWRRVSNFLGSEAVAYDLPQVVQGQKATLYVVHRTVAGLRSFPPSVPAMSTGGNSAAAWQAGKTLYVLVVQGDAGTYSQYLDRSTGPLT